jgi:hypothetical protein
LGQSTLVVLCAGSTLLLVQSYAPDKAPYIIVWSCCQASEHQPSEVGYFSYLFNKPWFHTEVRIAAVLIIPSSWGSQLGGHLHAISGTATSRAKAAVALARGEGRSSRSGAWRRRSGAARESFHGGWRAREPSLYSARASQHQKISVRDSAIARAGKDSFPTPVWPLEERGSVHARYLTVKRDRVSYWVSVGDALTIKID